MSNLSKELYSKTLFELWSSKRELYPHESYLLSKYLIDTSKSVVEAGTGGGRIAFYIEELGFKNVRAFDFVPEMIVCADSIKNQKKSDVVFEVADATNLTIYPNDSFDYLIYFQQVLGFIPNDELFFQSLKEAYRIAKKDAIILFTFSEWDSRFFNPLLSVLVNLVRFARGEKYQKRYLPWLKLNERINWKFLNKNQALVHWVKRDELISTLERIGFTVVEIKGSLELVCKKN